MPEPVVKLSSQDAAERGLTSGELVRVTSPVNREGIIYKPEITDTLKPGVIDFLHGWAQANAKELLSRDFEPLSGFPPFKEGLCQVARADI